MSVAVSFRFRAILLALLVSSYCSANLAATVNVRLDPSQARIGDTLSYELRLNGVSSGNVVFPATLPDPFVVLWVDSSRVKDGAMRYTITATDTGRLDLELALPVRHDGSVDTLRTPVSRVFIQSVISDTAANLRPLKPFRKHPFQWRELLSYVWIPIAALVVLAIWWVWRRYFRKEAKEARLKPELLLPAHELAVRELIQLRDAKYPSRGMLKEFFTEFSLIMRRYLERRYRFPALEMTTLELESELGETTYPEELRLRLVPALREADLVKFAKHLPDFSRCDSYIDLGFEMVDLTKPQFETSPEGAEVAEKAA